MAVHRSYNYAIERWTKQAVDCYRRGCICEGCPVYEFYFKISKRKCQMKKAVIESVRVLGMPKEDEENDE